LKHSHLPRNRAPRPLRDAGSRDRIKLPRSLVSVPRVSNFRVALLILPSLSLKQLKRGHGLFPGPLHAISRYKRRDYCASCAQSRFSSVGSMLETKRRLTSADSSCEIISRKSRRPRKELRITPLPYSPAGDKFSDKGFIKAPRYSLARARYGIAARVRADLSRVGGRARRQRLDSRSFLRVPSNFPRCARAPGASGMFPRRVRPPSGEKTPDEPVATTTTPRTAQAGGEFIGYDFPRAPALAGASTPYSGRGGGNPRMRESRVGDLPRVQRANCSA